MIEDRKEKIVKLLKTVDERKHIYRVYCDWIETMAIFISNTTKSCDKAVWTYRQSQYERILREYKEAGIEKFFAAMTYLKEELEYTMGDVLGDIYTDLGAYDRSFAQIFTPPHITDYFAELGLSSLNNEEVIFEPCCGSGSLSLGAIRFLKDKDYDYKNKVLFKAQDIDINCVHMTYVQLAFLDVKGFVWREDIMKENQIKDEDCYITPQLASALRRNEGNAGEIEWR